MQQVTGKDVRVLASCLDGGGNEFRAYTEGTGYKLVIKRVLGGSGTVENVPVPAHEKAAAVDLMIVGANLRVFAALRLGPSGDFPAYVFDIVGVAVPLGSAPGSIAPPVPPASGGSGVDQVARDSAKAAQNAANAAQGTANEANRKVEEIRSGVFTDSMIRAFNDMLWSSQTLKDRVYTWLQDAADPIYQSVVAIARKVKAE